MRRIKFKSVYQTFHDLARDCYTIMNNEPTFSVTLQSATASTVVSNQLAGIDSVISFMPTTSAAAAEVTAMFVSSQDDGSFTLTHSSGASTRTFKYFIHG